MEERWEAVEECERIALAAESRGAGSVLGFARTERGLELLRANGMRSVDIANWRYGLRLQRRHSLLWWTAAAFAVLAGALGVRAAFETGSKGIGFYVAVLAAFWLGKVWRKPPRPWIRIARGTWGFRMIWAWILQDIHFELANGASRPRLVIPRLRKTLRLRGDDAAEFLAALLPKLNGADCADVPLRDVVTRVNGAERAARNHTASVVSKAGRRNAKTSTETPDLPRPWERIASSMTTTSLLQAEPELRLALEMAVTEEMERRELASAADAAVESWRDEEEIAAINDDLFLPESITNRLKTERAARTSRRRPDGGES